MDPPTCQPEQGCRILRPDPPYFTNATTLSFAFTTFSSLSDSEQAGGWVGWRRRLQGVDARTSVHSGCLTWGGQLPLSEPHPLHAVVLLCHPCSAPCAHWDPCLLTLAPAHSIASYPDGTIFGGPIDYRWAIGTTRWGRDVLDWVKFAGTNATEAVEVRRLGGWDALCWVGAWLGRVPGL